ncbi:spermatogenesis-associated protein 17 isoform X2 [Psammomys obesus]|uniref:spermatogenesis-associated protein 17 isoform X2 n=1 Tax=Psammomys obesus TaxID=48139 RepID=UPI002452E75A|nr:spermatogenesis-associated protein 17 isoform X2 [Psammomys obesus]
MATLAKLQARASFLESQYYFRNRAVDMFRKKENDAAVLIQSWFRGCQVRAYIRHLNRVVTVMQKWWRSYLGRKQYQFIVEIQRQWRGYRIRKYCFNYYYLKEYLKAVSETNDAIREALEEFTDMKEREERKARLEQEEKEKEEQARKMHYMLSTRQIPGVFNSPFRKQPDPWELRLQKVKPLPQPAGTVTKSKSCHSLRSWLACTSARSFPHSASLPPIDRKRCQGPFRDINEVWQQRYKPLEPTLRVAEPINHLQLAREALKVEEEMRNVNDKMFLPFTSNHKNEKYIPMIHTSSKYNSGSYGQTTFRSQDPKKWICDKDFQTVLPSFELFSKFGKLYSKAGEIV